MASVARVTADLGGVQGSPGASVFHFSIAGAVTTAPEANDIAGRVRAFWNAMVTYLCGGLTITVDPSVQTFDAVGGLLLGVTGAVPPAVITLGGTASLPKANMLGITYRTSTIANNRLLAGRTFVGPLDPGAVTTAGAPVAGAKTALLTAAAALGTGATGSQFVIWHRPGPLGQPGGLGPVTSQAAADKLWVLRSRRD